MGDKTKDLMLQQGAGAIGSIVNAGLGLALGGIQDRRQRRQEQKLQDMAIRGNKEMLDYSYGKQMQMWKDTNYSAQVAELEKAGLNPALLYGMSGGGGTTTGSGSASVSQGHAPVGGGEAMQMMGMGLQMKMTQAQTDLLHAQAEKAKVEAEKLAGVDSENVKADTALKIASEIIAKYTGKEAKDQYEKIKSPARLIESKTWQDELEARQGVAGTIYELWAEGKLKEKSWAEIEGLLLDNANKSLQGEQLRAATKKIHKDIDLVEKNIKTADLNNIILELEKDLQTQTGIDRNSAGWLKILGRLFVTLFN